jgi:DNA-directed RNA polymerase specialized sigma24 family protein
MDDATSGVAPRTSGAWPDTPWTLIRSARQAPAVDRRAALSTLLGLYYKPVQRFFRRALRLREDAALEVTQDLFARLLEQDFPAGLTHETSLRGFLKVACRRHLGRLRSSEAARAGAIAGREGGEAEPSAEEALDAALDDELRRTYLEEAVGRVREELLAKGKEEILAVFEARTKLDDSKPEPYKELAGRFGKRVYDIRNHLAAARKIFRRQLLRLAAERADDPRAELRELGLLRWIE